MDKSLFKRAFLTRRCLIPATGFYEWARADGRTQPYYIHLKTEPVFSFAGLYDSFVGKDGKEHKVYTILTTRSNRLLEPIHTRMPVILRRRDENRWLSQILQHPSALLALLKPYPEAQIALYPMSRAVK
jgi:putative SOS response-associated peptidase YedK